MCSPAGREKIRLEEAEEALVEMVEVAQSDGGEKREAG